MQNIDLKTMYILELFNNLAFVVNLKLRLDQLSAQDLEYPRYWSYRTGSTNSPSFLLTKW